MHLRREIDVGRELVGVPAEQHVAGVGVDRTERARRAGDFQFMLHRVAGERGVVGLEVQLEVLAADRIRAGSSDTPRRRNRIGAWSAPSAWARCRTGL